MTNPDKRPWRQRFGLGKLVGEAMITEERRAIGAATALQRASDKLDTVRSFEALACIKDKDEAIARERAFMEKALTEIIADLSPWASHASSR